LKPEDQGFFEQTENNISDSSKYHFEPESIYHSDDPRNRLDLKPKDNNNDDLLDDNFYDNNSYNQINNTNDQCRNDHDFYDYDNPM